MTGRSVGLQDLSQILLVTDCDGTLLQDDKTISSTDLNAIGKFQAAGGNFTIATGRSIPTGTPVLRQLELKLPCILYNGSMLYDFLKDEILWMAEIPQNARFLVEKAIKRFGAPLGVEILTPEGMNVVAFNQLVDAHLNGRTPIPYRLTGIREILDRKWLKVMMAMPEALMPEVSAFLLSFETEGVRFVRSEKLFYEILPAEASKGNALKRLCRETGFSLARTVAMGDCDNDIEMLQQARVGIAVENAFPAAKAAADFVTVSNRKSAVARTINELMADPDTFFKRGKKQWKF